MLRCKDCTYFTHMLNTYKINWCEKFKAVTNPEQQLCEYGEMKLNKKK